jgi:antitoxin component of MazEF toxin-antitoxin module
MATARVSRWGNSLGVRLPRKVAITEGIKEGDIVLVIKNGITVEELLRRFPTRRTKRSIDKMVKQARRGWNE